jgi:hypothetical protein
MKAEHDVQLVCTLLDCDQEMNMRSTVTLAVLSGVLLSAGVMSPVLAAKHKPEKMTCEEFLVLDDTIKPKVVYWAEGFNHKGQAADAVVDIEATDKLVPTLVMECKEAPKATLWEKIKKHF